MINTLYGSFTADGNNKILELGVNVEWFRLINDTEFAATNNGRGYVYEWHKGMGTKGYRTYHPAGDHTTANDIIATGFNQIDSSNYTIGAAVVVTGGTDDVRPVYSTASTTGISEGTVIRIQGSAQLNLHGMDFSVDDVNLDTDFRLANYLKTAPGVIAGVCTYRIIAPNREVYDASMAANRVGGYFPGKRRIIQITQAASAVVHVAVDHGYTIGQRVRLKVPSYYGMVEMNNLVGKVTAVTAGTFTVDIDSTAFTVFKFPIFSVPEFIDAYCIPNGETLTSGFDGAVRNTAFKGFVLNAGTTSPAGSSGDTIRWRAGKSATVI